MNEELYFLLGVEKTASEAEIRSSFRKLAKIHHPDKGGDPNVFVRLTMAYNTLSNPETRAKYDKTGEIGEDSAQKQQRALIQDLGNLFTQVLMEATRPLNEIDIVQNMRRYADMYRGEHASVAGNTKSMLEKIEKVRDRIKPKDESAENTFMLAVEAKVAECARINKEANAKLQAIERVIEELGRHESIVDIVRTVQFGESGFAHTPFSSFWIRMDSSST